MKLSLYAVAGFCGGQWQTDRGRGSKRDHLTWFQAPLINSSSDKLTALIKSVLLSLDD